MAEDAHKKRAVSPSLLRMSHLQAEFSKLESDWKELQAHRPASRVRSRPSSREVGIDYGSAQPGASSSQPSVAGTSSNAGTTQHVHAAGRATTGVASAAAVHSKFQDDPAAHAAAAGGTKAAAVKHAASSGQRLPAGPNRSPFRPLSPTQVTSAPHAPSSTPQPHDKSAAAPKAAQTPAGKNTAQVACSVPYSTPATQRANVQAGSAGPSGMPPGQSTPHQPAAAVSAPAVTTPATASKATGSITAGGGAASGSHVKKKKPNPNKRPAWNDDFVDMPEAPFTVLAHEADSGTPAAAPLSAAQQHPASQPAAAATPGPKHVQAPPTLTVIRPDGVSHAPQVGTPVLAQHTQPSPRKPVHASPRRPSQPSPLSPSHADAHPQQPAAMSPTSPSLTLGSVGSRIPSPGPSQRSGSTGRHHSRIPNVTLEPSAARFSDMEGESSLGLSILSDSSPGPSPNAAAGHDYGRAAALAPVPEQPELRQQQQQRQQQGPRITGATPSGSNRAAAGVSARPQRRLWNQDSAAAGAPGQVGPRSTEVAGAPAAQPGPAPLPPAADAAGLAAARRKSSGNGSLRPTPPSSPPGVVRRAARGASEDGGSQARQGRAALSAAVAAAAAGAQSADELNTSLQRRNNPDFMRKLSALKRTVTVPDVGAGIVLGIPATVHEDEQGQHGQAQLQGHGSHPGTTRKMALAGRSAEDQPLAVLASGRRSGHVGMSVASSTGVAGAGVGRPGSRGGLKSPAARTHASPLRGSHVPAERVQSPVVLGSDVERVRTSGASRPATPSGSVPQPTAVMVSGGQEVGQLPFTSELLVVGQPEQDREGEPVSQGACGAAGNNAGASKQRALAALARQRNSVVSHALAAAAATAAAAAAGGPGPAGEQGAAVRSSLVADTVPVVLGDGAGGAGSAGAKGSSGNAGAAGAGGAGADSYWGAPPPCGTSTSAAGSYMVPSGPTSWEGAPGAGLAGTSSTAPMSSLDGAGGSGFDAGGPYSGHAGAGARQRARWQIPQEAEIGPGQGPPQAVDRWGQPHGPSEAAVTYAPLVQQALAAPLEQLPAWAGGVGGPGEGANTNGRGQQPLSIGPMGAAPGPPGYMLMRNGSDNYGGGMRPQEWQLPQGPPHYQPPPPPPPYPPHHAPPPPPPHVGYGAPPPWAMQGPPAGLNGPPFAPTPLQPPPPPGGPMWAPGFGAGGPGTGGPQQFAPYGAMGPPPMGMNGLGMNGMGFMPQPQLPNGYGNHHMGPPIDPYGAQAGYGGAGHSGRLHPHHPNPELPDYLRQSRSKFTTGWTASPHAAEAGALSAFADVWRQRQQQQPGRSAAELANERRQAALQSAFEGMSLGEVLARAPKKEPPFPKKNGSAVPSAGQGGQGQGSSGSGGGAAVAGGAGGQERGSGQLAL